MARSNATRSNSIWPSCPKTAAQTNYFALYLTSVYQDAQLAEWFRSKFKKADKKLDMGKSCLRFRKLDDLPLDVIGEVIARTSPEQMIASHEASRRHAANA